MVGAASSFEKEEVIYLTFCRSGRGRLHRHRSVILSRSRNLMLSGVMNMITRSMA